jgi:Protein of unknown function (DUF1579)
MKRMRHLFAAGVMASLICVQGAAGQGGQPPKPTPEHERLAFFVGKWTAQGDVKPGPMGPGGKMTSNDNCEWFDGHYSVICHSEGTTPMGPSKSLGILSYNPEEKVYTYYGTDNSGMTMSSVPKGTYKDGTWTYFDQGTMGGKPYKSRVIIKQVSPTSYNFKMDVQGADGKWMPMMESMNKKQ